jgi:proteasome accessory factor B
MKAPIAYDRNRKGFYYENDTWMLPSVLLSEGELLAVLLAAKALEQYGGTPVGEQLERIFGKLADMLPDKIALRPEQLYAGFTFRGPPAKPVDADVWSTVVQGVLRQQTLRMRYCSFEMPKDQTPEEVLIDPYHIANLQGEWYLLGVYSGNDDVYQLALPRVSSAALTDQHFEVPAAFDARQLLAGTFGRFIGDGTAHRVRLLFDKEVANWVTERQWHPSQQIRTRKNGAVELEFEAAGLYEVQRWVLSWGSQVQVLAPAELVQMVTEEVAAMARIAGTGRRPCK